MTDYSYQNNPVGTGTLNTPETPLAPEDGRLYVTEGGAITRTVADILSSPSRAKAAATMADLRSSNDRMGALRRRFDNPEKQWNRAHTEALFNEIERRRDDAQFLRATADRVNELNVSLAAERDRLRAALAALKDLTCGECVPCQRINAEIDKALSGEPNSAHETNGESNWKAVRAHELRYIESVLLNIRCQHGENARESAHDTLAWLRNRLAVKAPETKPEPDVGALNRQLCEAEGHVFSRFAMHHCLRCEAAVTPGGYLAYTSSQKAPETSERCMHGRVVCEKCATLAINRHLAEIREIHDRHQQINKLLYGPSAQPGTMLGPMDSDAAHTDRGRLLSLLPIPPPSKAPETCDNEGEWVIVYADQDRLDEHFSGAGARAAAEGRFRQLTDSWTCRLFRCVAKTGYGPPQKAKCEHAQEIGSYCGECPSDIAE